jgi:transcription initiation factor TFIID subunit 2
MGKLRGPTGFCPPAVTRFILSLLSTNDNSRNGYADDYYKAALVEALGETSTSFLTTCRFTEVCESSRAALVEIVKMLNLEVTKPSYRLCVTVACLKAIRRFVGICLPAVGNYGLGLWT